VRFLVAPSGYVTGKWVVIDTLKGRMLRKGDQPLWFDSKDAAEAAARKENEKEEA
jgi:hypothetical protein